MTDSEQWDALVADWQEKHNAVVAFQLFEAGTMRNERLNGYQSIVASERAARQRMDDFIASYRARGS